MESVFNAPLLISYLSDMLDGVRHVTGHPSGFHMWSGMLSGVAFALQ